MLFQEAPPDTSVYMIAGYVIFFLILVIYLASLFIRTRNLNQDLTTLETMRKEKMTQESQPAPARRKPAAKKPPSPKPVRRKVSRKR